MTQAGVILGTASYMSPEQARAQEVDKRADIWSFGVVLFEMLAGGRIYSGDTITDILGAIVHKEPDWERLPANLPRSIERMLRRCLEKDRQRRVQDIGDARIELEDSIEQGDEAPVRSAPATTGGVARLVPWAIAGLGLILAAWGFLGRSMAPTGPERDSLGHYDIVLPPDQIIYREGQAIAVSPDGHSLVYSAQVGDATKLFVRLRDRFEARELAETGGAEAVFFSPDGQWVAFFAKPSLFKINIRTGRPIKVSDSVSFDVGGSWGDDGSIVYAPTWGVGLVRVSAAGGAVEQLTTPDRDAGEVSHIWPEILPGSRTVLYTAWTAEGGGRTKILALDLITRKTSLLLENARVPRYSGTGHLLFLRGPDLMAVPFDVDRIAAIGEPGQIATDVRLLVDSGGGVFDVSSEGTLVFQGGGEWTSEREAIWVDRAGREEPALEDHRDFEGPSLSPDGRRLAITVRGTVFQVWMYDLVAGTRAQITREGDNGGPSWFPGGRELVYWSSHSGAGSTGSYAVVRRAIDGRSTAVQIAGIEGNVGNPLVNPDGDMVLYESSPGSESSDLLYAPLNAEGESLTWVATRGNDFNAAFSPSGDWVAYESDESGRGEIYLAPFPGPGPSWLVSADGGSYPQWSPDGRELFYRRAGAMMAVAVETGEELRLGKPERLFESEAPVERFAVSPDGRFLMIRQLADESPEDHQLRVILDWPQLLAESP